MSIWNREEARPVESVGLDLEAAMKTAVSDESTDDITEYRAYLALRVNGENNDDMKASAAQAMKRLKISGAAANHDLKELRRHIMLEAQLKNYPKDIEKLKAATASAIEKLAQAKTALATAEGEFQKAYQAESSLNTNKVSADTLRKKNLRLFAPSEELGDFDAVRRHYAGQHWPV